MTKNPVIVSGLWPKNQAVSAHLAISFGFDIAMQRGGMSQDYIDIIKNAGRRCLFLQEGEYQCDSRAVEQETLQRLRAVARPLAARAREAIGAARGEKVAQSLMNVLCEKFHGALLMVAALDALAQRENVRAVLLNESEALFGKTAALWARARGIPSFVLSHGAGVGEAYTATADFVADHLLFGGRRGAEAYLDLDFPADRMLICGNPAWDDVSQLLAQKEEVRRKTREALAIDSSEHIVVFGTTWNAKLTALQDTDVYGQTLRAFLEACSILRASGVKFHAVVKDRPPNAEFGSARTRAIAKEVGLEHYHYATGGMFEALMSADLFVGYDTSAFVEAALMGVPAINIWAPSSFLIGPSLDRSDEIPMVKHNAPGALAEVMAVLLRDEQARAELNEAMARNVERFAYSSDGQASLRCAAAVASRLSAS